MVAKMDLLPQTIEKALVYQRLQPVLVENYQEMTKFTENLSQTKNSVITRIFYGKIKRKIIVKSIQ